MTTLTFTWSWVMPSSRAMFCWARIGTFRPAQISARSSRTSAMAAYGSSAALLRNMNSKSRSTCSARIGTCGTTIGSSAARRPSRIDSSFSPARSPRSHSTSIFRMALMHWPKVLARTAMPVGTCATWVTPFIFRICFSLRSRTGRPRCVGGRQTIVGLAPLTCRSVEKSFCPVTAALASVRLRPVPMTRYSSRGRSVTPTCLMTWLAASAARSP